MAALLLLSTCAASAQTPRAVSAATWQTTVVVNVPFPVPKGRSANLATAALPPVTRPGLHSGNHELAGIASFYWQATRTANGEFFDRKAMTAAHKTLPFGTMVRVTNLSNGQSVVVRINDRGPFKPGRVIDVSMGAAIALGMHSRGLTQVTLAVID